MRLHLSVTVTLALAACMPRVAPPPVTEAPLAEQLRAMASIPPDQLEARGMAAAQVGDYPRAEQYLQAAIVRGAPEERVLPRLLRVCIVAQHYRAALEFAQPYLSAHDEAWQLRYLVATILIGLGEPANARHQLEMVIRSNPQHAESQFLLASLLRDDLNDPSGADAHFREYLVLEPAGRHAGEARNGLLQHVASP